MLSTDEYTVEPCFDEVEGIALISHELFKPT